jgi:hypothetical protein
VGSFTDDSLAVMIAYKRSLESLSENLRRRRSGFCCVPRRA